MVKKKILAMGLTVTLATGALVIPNSESVSAGTSDKEVLSPAYFFDFENGYESTGTVGGTAQVVGTGTIEADIWDSDSYRFGKVYHNDADSKFEVRANYLRLPDIMDTVIDAGNKEMTIGFWVNKADAHDFWCAPIFSMYKEQTATDSWPMFILQTRLLAQVNCAGYCNFEAALNEKGENTENTFWLDDGKWHYYTATITKDTIKVYVDGEVQNSWKVNNTEAKQLEGLFSEYAKTDLNYVCLGGNQAWDWADPDASFAYDDVAIYTSALTQDQIKLIINEKQNTPSVYVQTKPEDDGEYTIRVVAEVALDGAFTDSLNQNYLGAGFRCTKDFAKTAVAEPYLSTVVFNTIMAAGDKVAAADGKYFIVTEIRDVGAEDVVYVTPAYKTADKETNNFINKTYTIDMANVLAQAK